MDKITQHVISNEGMLTMKIIGYLLLWLSVGVAASFAATHSVSFSGFAFSPDSISINQGDTVSFTLSAIHNAVEVSQSTWIAGGTTALPGGFSVPFGGGSAVLSQAGKHYYVCTNHASMGMKGIIVVNPSGTTSVGDGPVLPHVYSLAQNYPDPFDPSTSITFSVPVSSRVTLRIYNVLGQEVSTLLDHASVEAGTHTVRFDAAQLSSGVYLYRMEAGDFVSVQKMILTR